MPAPRAPPIKPQPSARDAGARLAHVTLAIGNKCYSSWSMRAWLLLRELGIPFEEVLIPLHRPDSREKALRHGPTGLVPVLTVAPAGREPYAVWETTAILEAVADLWVGAGVWPDDPPARALARSLAAEMHAGFRALRSAMPVNLGRRFAHRDRGVAVRADVERVAALWRDARRRFGERADGPQAGPFLFGRFSGVDAMYAPVVTRLDSYGWPVDEDTRRYMDAVLGTQSFQAWRADALREPWVIAEDEVDEPAVEDYRCVVSAL